MQSCNLNTMDTINTIWNYYYISIDNLLFFDVKKMQQQLSRLKNKVVSLIKIAAFYTILFVFLAGSLLIEGVSVVNGAVCFSPELVIVPALEALLGIWGVYIMLEMIKYAFRDIKKSI